MREIQTLVNLEDSEHPIVSCYLARDPEADEPSPVFEDRVRELLTLADPRARPPLEAAFGQIRHYLATEVHAMTRGVAALARAGLPPFFLARQFHVPLPDHVSVNTAPDVYHLVEIKDTDDRYVVLIASERSARILEVKLGAVPRDLWAKRPELQARVGCRRILVPSCSTSSSWRQTPRPARWSPRRLSSFTEDEQQASRNAVTELVNALWSDGLAVVGVSRALEALWQHRADVLILASELSSGPAWICRECSWTEAVERSPDNCAWCESTSLRPSDSREAMVQLAEASRSSKPATSSCGSAAWGACFATWPRNGILGTDNAERSLRDGIRDRP